MEMSKTLRTLLFLALLSIAVSLPINEKESTPEIRPSVLGAEGAQPDMSEGSELTTDSKFAEPKLENPEDNVESGIQNGNSDEAGAPRAKRFWEDYNHHTEYHPGYCHNWHCHRGHYHVYHYHR